MYVNLNATATIDGSRREVGQPRWSVGVDTSGAKIGPVLFARITR